MSDTSGGPGWWLASDGKWYPPHLQPGPVTPQPAQQTQSPFAPYGGPAAPPSRPVSAGLFAVIGVAMLALVAVVAFAAARSHSSRARGDTLRCAIPCAPAASTTTGSTSTTSSSSVVGPQPRPGYTVYTGADFSLLLPEDTTATDLSATALLAFEASDAAKNNPSVAAAVAELETLPAGAGKFLAVSASASATITLFTEQSEVPLDVETARTKLTPQLEAAGASNVNVELDTLPNGQALKATFTQSITATPASAPLAIQATEYYLPLRGQTWILGIDRLTTDTDRTIADTIGSSLAVFS